MEAIQFDAWGTGEALHTCVRPLQLLSAARATRVGVLGRHKMGAETPSLISVLSAIRHTTTQEKQNGRARALNKQRALAEKG